MQEYNCSEDFVIRYDEYSKGIRLVFDNVSRNDMTSWFATKDNIRNLINFLESLIAEK